MIFRQTFHRLSSTLARRRAASSYIAAIDQGTSSTRVILYCSDTLQPKASHQIDLQSATSTPHPGWVEMNPTALLQSVETCFEHALAKAETTASSVVSVGITNQRESLVVWDRQTGAPLHDVILWLDTRTRTTVADLEKELGSTDALRGTTGLPLSTYFTGVKLKWMLDNVPTVRHAIEQGTAYVGTIDAYLAEQLTGEHITDVTNASRTLMMDLATCAWSTTAIDALGMGMSSSTLLQALPRIVSSADSADNMGRITSGAFKGVPLTGIIGDQQSAMVGQRCFTAGMAKTTFGTGAFTLLHTGSTAFPSENGLLTTALYSEPGPLNPTSVKYALEGSVGSCAVGINWFQHKLDLFDSPQEMDSLAQQALSTHGTEGLYFVSAFGGLLAPYWRDDARGTMVGLTLAHDKTHVALSIIEGIAFQVNDVVTAMVNDTDGKHPLVQMQVDGGVCMSNPLLQTQANLLQANVVRPPNIETTALGAAIVSGAGANCWGKYEDAPGGGGGGGGVGKTFTCGMDDKDRRNKLDSWNAAVQSSLGWAGRL